VVPFFVFLLLLCLWRMGFVEGSVYLLWQASSVGCGVRRPPAVPTTTTTTSSSLCFFFLLVSSRGGCSCGCCCCCSLVTTNLPITVVAVRSHPVTLSLLPPMDRLLLLLLLASTSIPPLRCRYSSCSCGVVLFAAADKNENDKLQASNIHASTIPSFVLF